MKMKIEEGLSLDVILNIKHYEKPVPNEGFTQGDTKGNWPPFFPHTDEERLQNVPEVLDELRGKDYVITEKCDGCLDENTIIETENGQKTIKEICEEKYKGKIKTFNININKIEWENIHNHSILENNQDWYEIELENGEKIKLTGNHRIWIPSLMCWRMVQDLIGNEDFLFLPSSFTKNNK